MATFFGEITALSSRAVDDEEIDDQPNYKLTVENKVASNTASCKLLLFSVGELATAFAKCYFVPNDATNLFNVTFSVDREDPEESLLYSGGLKFKTGGSKAASVYTVNSNCIVCEISAYIPDELCVDLCQLLLDKINCDEVLILASRHMALFKAEECLTSEQPFLKSLATSQYLAIRNCPIPRLQAPNFLSSFPATVLAEFEVKRRPALCIINYVDSDNLDSLSVQNYETVLNEYITSLVTCNVNAKAKLAQHIKVKQCNESNLYT